MAHSVSNLAVEDLGLVENSIQISGVGALEVAVDPVVGSQGLDLMATIFLMATPELSDLGPLSSASSPQLIFRTVHRSELAGESYNLHHFF